MHSQKRLQETLNPCALTKIHLSERIKKFFAIIIFCNFFFATLISTAANPRFGEGGPQKISPRFCQHSEAKSSE